MSNSIDSSLFFVFSFIYWIRPTWNLFSSLNIFIFFCQNAYRGDQDGSGGKGDSSLDWEVLTTRKVELGWAHERSREHARVARAIRAQRDRKAGGIERRWKLRRCRPQAASVPPKLATICCFLWHFHLSRCAEAFWRVWSSFFFFIFFSSHSFSLHSLQPQEVARAYARGFETIPLGHFPFSLPFFLFVSFLWGYIMHFILMSKAQWMGCWNQQYMRRAGGTRFLGHIFLFNHTLVCLDEYIEGLMPPAHLHTAT